MNHGKSTMLLDNAPDQTSLPVGQNAAREPQRAADILSAEEHHPPARRRQHLVWFSGFVAPVGPPPPVPLFERFFCDCGRMESKGTFKAVMKTKMALPVFLLLSGLSALGEEPRMGLNLFESARTSSQWQYNPAIWSKLSFEEPAL